MLQCISLTRCRKHSSGILVDIDMTVSHSCSRIVSCTSMMWLMLYHISKVLFQTDICWLCRASEQRTVMLQKPVWGQFDFGFVTRYPAGSRNKLMGTPWSVWQLNNAQQCAKEISTTTYLNHWFKTGWNRAFMLFTSNLDPAFWKSLHKFSAHANCSPSSCP